MRLSSRSLSKSFRERAHGEMRSYFAAILSSHAVGYNEKPPVRAGKLRRGWNELAEAVLVILAQKARIGQPCEFNLQH